MIHFEVTGPGDAEILLLSAGLGGSGAYWAANLAALSQTYRVVTYDQRGTGRSPDRLPETTSIEAMADDAEAVLDQVGAARCRFIGHALGGLVGLALAARSPARISDLIIVNGWLRMDPHTARCFDVRCELLLRSGIEAYVQAQPLFLYPSRWMADNASLLAHDAAHAVAAFPGTANVLSRIAALRAFDGEALLSQLACRVLLIVSEDDMLVPPICSEQLHAACPGSRLARLDGGHACNITNPEGFAALCLGFFSE